MFNLVKARMPFTFGVIILDLVMLKLNFPEFSFRTKSSENKLFIFDAIRKKFVRLLPEEWVRQHVIQYLISEKQYPSSLINVEKTLQIGSLSKRYDLVVFNTDGSIKLLVECKAPDVAINQETFNQIARYNMSLKAHYLMVTNGLEHYYCTVNYNTKQYNFLKTLPSYKS